MNKINIISDNNKKSKILKNIVKKIINKKIINRKNLNIVIGGDGFMLKVLKRNKNFLNVYYGINSGNYGFLMNKFSIKGFNKKLNESSLTKISPLEMQVNSSKKVKKKYLAINEVSILRQSRQAAYLSIKNNSKLIIKKLIADGVLISTPAGSTAYNLSVNGPILDLDSKKISIASISAFRPRRWQGKILSDSSIITIINLDKKKRPVSAVADNVEIRNANKIVVKIKNKIKYNLLYNKNSSLDKKINLEKLKKEIK